MTTISKEQALAALEATKVAKDLDLADALYNSAIVRAIAIIEALPELDAGVALEWVELPVGPSGVKCYRSGRWWIEDIGEWDSNANAQNEMHDLSILDDEDQATFLGYARTLDEAKALASCLQAILSAPSVEVGASECPTNHADGNYTGNFCPDCGERLQ